MKIQTLLALVSALSLTACIGPRAFTRGVYDDPSTIELLSDRFSENDLQLIAKKMVASLSTSPGVAGLEGRPLLMVGRLQNRTSEHVDMASLGDKVRVELSKTGRFAFVDVAARGQLAEEYAYETSGYMPAHDAKRPGAQSSPDYVLTGSLASIVHEVGSDELVYYKMTMQLTDLRTGVIAWTEEKQLRKKFEKQAVGW